YVITDYERSNYSISQARFADVSQPEIVPISAATIPSDTSREGPISAATISSDNSRDDSNSSATRSSDDPRKNVGIAVSAVMLSIALVIVLSALCYCHKRRKTAELTNRSATKRRKDRDVSSRTARPANVSRLREIAENSAIWPFRELPDTGKAEAPIMNSPTAELAGRSEHSTSMPDLIHDPEASQETQPFTPGYQHNRHEVHLQNHLDRGFGMDMDQPGATSFVDV
ncbi:MAG: hypothetical protein Q9183_006150, partial [Haloplaca sp. 2 TL-2023]